MNMRQVVFAGPSLYKTDAMTTSGIRFHGPIKDGDLSCLTEDYKGPMKVLIVDGVFGAGQAITLTEIRSFISAECILFGSTSMGALRAVEAGPIGMQGLGSIFREYRDGIRVRDSDVALLHGEDNRPMTVPLVNIELLAEILVLRGLSKESTFDFLIKCEEVHFSRRDMSTIVKITDKSCGREDIAFGDLFKRDGLVTWDAKRHDALHSFHEFVHMDFENSSTSKEFVFPKTHNPLSGRGKD